MSMTESEIKTFWSGVMAAQNGKILLTKTNNGHNDIVNITFKEGYTGDIIMSNGDVYTITKVELDNNGRIIGAYVKKNNITKYIPCTYNNNHLESVGVVLVNDIDKLNLIDYKDGNIIRW